MGSILIFVSEFAVFSLILGLYLLRRHALRKEASSVELPCETSINPEAHRSNGCVYKTSRLDPQDVQQT
jgi:hypothetical protein